MLETKRAPILAAGEARVPFGSIVDGDLCPVALLYHKKGRSTYTLVCRKEMEMIGPKTLELFRRAQFDAEMSIGWFWIALKSLFLDIEEWLIVKKLGL